MARGKANKTGRNAGSLGAFTPIKHEMMDCLAFSTLPPLAQCLYWRLSRRSGVKGAHNGKVFYSVREAAEDFTVSKDTASAAFHLLQARGFIRPVAVGRLGMEGQGRATTWHLTEWPAANGALATKDFLAWKPGADFPVAKGPAPRHVRKPVLPTRTACPPPSDEGPPRRSLRARACPPGSDDGAGLVDLPVRPGRTPKDSARGTRMRGREAA